MSKKVIFGKKSKDEGKIIYVSAKDFQSPQFGDEYQELAIKEIHRLRDLKFQNIPFPKLFDYKENSLWWFLYPQIFPVFANTLSFVTNFSKFLDETKPGIIQVKQDYSRLSIIKQICAKKNVKLSYSFLDLMKYQIQNKIKSKIRNFGLKVVTWKKIRKRRSIYFKKEKSLPNLENKILFPTLPVYRRGIINTKKSIPEIGEYFTQEIVDLISDKYQTVGIDLISKIKSDNHTLIERLNSEMEWVPLEILIVKMNLSAKKIFLKNYSNLISSTEFQKLFNFQDIEIWDSLKDIFEKMKFGFYLPYYLNLIDSLTKLFLTHKPKAVVLLFETGPIALGFINACKKQNIKIIGLQHGLITRFHKNYCHNKFSTTKEPYQFPLPDKLLLHGNITKKILEENHYPLDRLVTFGNPVFFNLNQIESYLKNKSLYEKYEIKKDKKIILLTTSGLQAGYNNTKKYDFDTQTWKVLLENFSNDPNIQLILKPHPAEDSKEYQKVLEKFPASDAKIIQGNLLELLFISSLTISIISSTVLDSLAMKRPVIQVKFGNYISLPWDDYHSKVVYSTEINDLPDSIQKILSNTSLYNDLINNGNKFINDHYNIPEKTPDLDLKRIIEE